MITVKRITVLTPITIGIFDSSSFLISSLSLVYNTLTSMPPIKEKDISIFLYSFIRSIPDFISITCRQSMLQLNRVQEIQPYRRGTITGILWAWAKSKSSFMTVVLFLLYIAGEKKGFALKPISS